MSLTPLSEDEITTLARRIVTNEVYVAWDVEQIDNSFGAILTLAGSQLAEIVEDIGLIYEDWSAASDRSVNGHPAFLSFKMVHVDSVPALLEKCREMLHALGVEGVDYADEPR